MRPPKGLFCCLFVLAALISGLQCESNEPYTTTTTTTTTSGASKAATDQTNTSRIRVLVIGPNNSTAANKQQRAIEEASELSLDLPRQVAGEAAKANGSELSSNQTSSSLGYKQVSLASLTLYQRQQAGPDNAATPATATATTTTTTSAPNTPDTQRQPEGHQSGPWSELNLARVKPSWLNVSNRFKITGSTIEEIEYLMPAEYLLRQAFDSPVLLKTKLGILEGVRSIKFNKHLYTFLSVPYARPPVDKLRFKAPQPAEKWTGILQTTKWPPFCVQPSMTLASKSSPVHVLSQAMSEDCLYLNIWTPSLKFSRARKRPVMVWLHGGAFQYGGISVDENDGSALALAGDVVVVTLNYRISAFGFLNANNPEEAPNNVGLLDQQMAMRWVQQNIKQFGGDPQQVTLFGESAGGHSVGLHLISPQSQPLFKRAIMQSGVPISFLRSYDVNADNKGSVIAEGVSSVMMARRLRCLNDTNGGEAGPTTTVMGTKIFNDNQPATALEDETTTTTSGYNTTTDLPVDEADPSWDPPILNNATIECMRQKSSLEILKAMGAPGNSGFFPTGNDPKGFFPNGQIMDSFDGENLKIGPQKDYLIGTNTDEGTFMLHYGMSSLFPARSEPKVSSIEALKAALQAEIDRSTRLQAELAKEQLRNSTKLDIQSASGTGNGGAQAHLYKPLLRTSTSVLEGFMPKSHVRVLDNGTVVGNTTAYSKEAEFGKAVGSLISDIIFLCPARTLARTLSEAGRNVYSYLYSHRSSLSQYHPWLGVTHHDEVEFVFGRPLRLADVYSGKDIEMSQRLMKTWSHFAYTGQMMDQMGVKWPKYGEEDNNYMNLATNEASVGQRYHDRVCNVYDTVISVHLQDT